MPIDNGNLALKGLDDLFSTEENRQEEQREQVQQSLKNNVARYVRMATQKCAGQRGNAGDLDTLESLNHTAMAIIIAATDLCLDGAFGPMPDKIEGDQYVWSERGT